MACWNNTNTKKWQSFSHEVLWSLCNGHTSCSVGVHQVVGSQLKFLAYLKRPTLQDSEGCKSRNTMLLFCRHCRGNDSVTSGASSELLHPPRWTVKIKLSLISAGRWFYFKSPEFSLNQLNTLSKVTHTGLFLLCVLYYSYLYIYYSHFQSKKSTAVRQRND